MPPVSLPPDFSSQRAFAAISKALAPCLLVVGREDRLRELAE